MPTHHMSTLATLAAICALSAVACSSSHGSVPEGASVEILQTEQLVLHGSAAPHPASASCTSTPKGPGTRYLQLNEATMGNILLRPTGGAAVLHVEELASNRTWCVMTRGDGTGASIRDEFPSGAYSITVEGSESGRAMPYAIVFEKL